MGPAFVLLTEDKLYSTLVNALIAKAREGGPTLLAAWHRDRRAAGVGGKGAPHAET